METTNTTISRLGEFIGQTVTLTGWVYNTRASGKIAFIILRDGTGRCQCVLEKNEQTEPFFNDIKKLPRESAVKVTGAVSKEERATGGFEMKIEAIDVVHSAEEFPITPKAHGVDFLLKHRHLHLRSQRQWCIAKIRHTVIDAVRRFFNDNGFTLIDTPILTNAAGEEQPVVVKPDAHGLDHDE